MNNTIEHLVAALPEKYQPIFGHPEISDNFSRACDDRLALVRETYEALQALHGRPLRVLDLGCAQGYFSLNLAAAGADVVGIDYLPANVAVCEALANECPDLKAKFHVGRIEDVIDKIQPSEFDLVLGFSVFHHVIHEKGALAVKDLLNTAVERVGCLLLEMALKASRSTGRRRSRMIPATCLLIWCLFTSWHYIQRTLLIFKGLCSLQAIVFGFWMDRRSR